MNNEILFKPNALILATHNNNLDITSNEYKLFDTLLQRCQYNNSYGWRKAEINREEIKKVIKHTENTTVKGVIKTLEKFKNISLNFKLGNKFVSGYAIAEYVYDRETDSFSCSMSDNVYTVLINYARYGYSPINLDLVRRSKSYYTQKIYGLFRMWSRSNETVTKTFTLSEIKSICDIQEGTSYDEYREFKRRVLLPALKEIESSLNMTIDYKEIRKMRRVSSIEFSITDHEPRKYKFEKDMLISEDIKETYEEIENDQIDSMDYVNLIDLNFRESIHKKFLNDFSDYKNYIMAVELASKRTLDSTGGKSINKRNYNYLALF